MRRKSRRSLRQMPVASTISSSATLPDRKMAGRFFTNLVRRPAVLCAALLLCTSLPAAAEFPELGGAKQFDLFCKGRLEYVQDYYIFIPMAGPGDIPRFQPAKSHVIVDLLSMNYQDVGVYQSRKEKIPLEKDGLLYLMNNRGYDRWAINLSTYKSVHVTEGDRGEIYIERMQCRP